MQELLSAETRWNRYQMWQEAKIDFAETLPEVQSLKNDIDDFFTEIQAECRKKRVNFSPLMEVWSDFLIAADFSTRRESLEEIRRQFELVKEALSDEYLANIKWGERVVPDSVRLAVNQAYRATGEHYVTIR
jgi:oligoendopeptidase F